MSIIQMKNLTFGYDGSAELVFDRLSLDLDSSWRLGITGRNGKGKSTLLRLLAGQLTGQGEILAPLSFQLFPCAAQPGETGLMLMERLASQGEYWQFCRELSLLELPEELLWRPYESLSGGEQTKLMIAALFLREDSYPLLDEPTNHLDQHARQVLGEYLARQKGFLLVSHDRALLDRCIDHILVLGKSRITVQKGNFSSWEENKSRQDQFEREENAKLERQIAHLTQAAARASGWSDRLEATKWGSRNSGLRPDRGYIGHKSAKMMKRAKAMYQRRMDAAEEKKALLHDIDHQDEIRLEGLAPPARVLVEARGLTFGYEQGRALTAPLDFQLRAGEHMALVGKNGCGKSTLIRLIAGEALPHEGSLFLPGGLKISYLPQQAEDFSGTLRQYAQRWQVEQTLFFTLLRKLELPSAAREGRFEEMSDGQKKKVMLARSLCQKAHLYLWDEPLNFMDVISRMQIEEMVAASGQTILYVEHDRRFCENTATALLDLDQFPPAGRG